MNTLKQDLAEVYRIAGALDRKESIIKRSCASCKYQKCGAYTQTTQHIHKRRERFPIKTRLAALNAIYEALAKYCKKYER